MGMAKNAAQQTVPDDELDELIDGLRQPEMMISPKYFYDERGSQLFEDITALPEYYLTDAELDIMRECVDEMAELKRRAGVDLFLFQDEFFVCTPAQVTAFCDTLEAAKLGVDWKAFGRVNLSEPDMMQRMAGTG